MNSLPPEPPGQPGPPPWSEPPARSGSPEPPSAPSGQPETPSAPYGYDAPPPPPPISPTGGGFSEAQAASDNQYGYGQAPVGATAPGQLSPQDERTWGMLAHLSALLASFVALAFLGPLLVMLIQGPKSAFVRRQAVEALNFQITTYIAGFISFLLLFVLVGFILLPVVGIAWLVFTIIAGLAANRGVDYRYPINLRLVK